MRRNEATSSRDVSRPSLRHRSAYCVRLAPDEDEEEEEEDRTASYRPRKGKPVTRSFCAAS
jgi:hypothetical protein